MNKNYSLLILFFTVIANSFGQTIAPGCSSALPFCAGTSSQGLSFPNTTNLPNNNTYSCLGSQPNASWYYLQISQAGNLTFTISQTSTAGAPIDVDFIAWGPFDSPTCGQTNLDATTQVGCSFSPAPTETFTINNAIIGKYYMVLMTNFRNLPGTISLAQTGGSGATSCDIVCPLTVVGGPVSDCIPTTLEANYLNSSATLSTFQWTFNGVNIPGPAGTSNPLGPLGTNTSVTQTFAAGSYCVTARSPGCSSTQSAKCTTINPGLPVPHNQPINLFACTGSTFNLRQIEASLGLVGNYTVYYNLDPIRAQTNASPRINPALQSAYPGNPAQISNGGQTIYVTIKDNSSAYCYTVAQFTLNYQVCAFGTTNTGPICAGNTFGLSASDPGVGAVTYSWTGPNGWTGSGQNISNVPCPTGTPPFNYICTATPTSGGALLTSTTTVVVNLIPVATATPVSNTICSGLTTDIPMGSNVLGTTFAWTVVQTNGSGASAGSGSNIAQLLTASGSLVGIADYTIIPTANGCLGTAIHSFITVNPTPIAIATPTPATICSGSTSNIVLTSTPSGATFAWTAVQTDVSGAIPGSGTSIAQLLTAPGNLAGTVDYTVTPTLNSCPGLPIRTTINVNPTPIAIATPVSTTICSGISSDIPLTSLVTGTTFAWTVVQNNVSGASDGNGTNITQALTTTTASSGTAVYSITPTANGCIGATIQITINVTPIPTASINYSGTPFCTSLSSGQPVTLSGTAAYTGGNYSSTLGLTLDATTGSIIPSSSTAGSYVVTYTTLASGGCTAIPVTTNVVITAVPTATINYAGTSFCSTLTTGQAITINGTAAYTGGTYSSTAGLTIDVSTGAITPSTSTAGSYIITYVIPPSFGCLSVSTTTNIEINNPAVATIAYSGSPYCSGLATANVTLTGAAGGTFTGTAGLIINAVTGSIDLSSPAGLYTVSYTIAPLGGCNAIVFTTQITINATTIPVTGFSYATPVCKNGSNPLIIPVSGFTTGGLYTSTTGLSINNSTGEINLALSVAGTYTVTYIVPATTCGPIGTNTSTIVITNVPTAAISYAGTPFCTTLTTGQAVSLTGTNAYTGGTYSSTVGLTIDATTGAITPSTSTAGSYLVTYTVLASAGCSAVPVTTNIIITATPTATISYAGTPFCTTLTSGQAVTLNGTAAYTGGTYSSTAGLTIDITTGAITPRTSTPGNYLVTYTIVAGSGCSQVIATTTVIINPIPVAIATPSSVTICSLDSTSIALTSNAIGTFYAWTSVQNNVSGATSGSGATIAQALTVTSTTPGTVVYTITPSGSGCTGLPITATVTVNPLPLATISGNTTICFGTSSAVDFAGTPNATVTYTINGGLNRTIILDNLGVASVPTGNLTATTTYELISVVSSGTPACTQLQSGIVTVMVVPIPLVNSIVSSPSVCSGQSTGISLSSNVAASIFNWTATQLGATGASAGTGAIISQNLTATGVLPGSVIYTITANVGACQGPATPVTITVNPIPVVTTSTVLQSVCSGSVTPILLSSNVVGTVFNWNVVQTNVTGASNGTGSVIAQALTTTSNNIGEAVYSITPLVGGCPGVPKIVVVSVNPIPVATANAAVTTICSSGITNIVLTSSVAGTTFSWTVIQSGIFGASSGSGATIAQTLTTVGSNQGTVRYTITPTFNSCPGTPITVTITVNPTPEVFGSSASTICSGESPSISLFPSIAATTFAWTVSQMNVTGAQAGTGVVINDVLTAVPNLGTVVYSVIPTANGCSGTPLLITVTVNPAPAPQINDGIICVDQASNVAFQTYILDTQLSNAAYDFVWYLNGVIISGAVNNTYEADESGTYSVLVTNTATGCISVMTNAVVVASYPGLTIETTQTLAFSDNATIEVAVTPPNTLYLYSIDNGPTQTSNVFTNVDPGSHTVTVTDENGCTNLSKPVNIIGYPTYFTPNGDGFHDTWNIVGLGSSAKVFIFDRYGKLVKQISPTGEGWDGTLNGEPLSSTDYWFTVDYTEDYPTVGTSKVFKSHFSLKR